MLLDHELLCSFLQRRDLGRLRRRRHPQRLFQHLRLCPCHPYRPRPRLYHPRLRLDRDRRRRQDHHHHHRRRQLEVHHFLRRHL